jgi:hypothetical protein
MDQGTVQTIIQGGILVTVIYIAGKVTYIAKTAGGGTKPPPPDTK